MKDLLRRSQMDRKRCSISEVVSGSNIGSNYVFRRKAAEDLTAIIDYIAQDNPKAALELYKTFVAQFEYLARFPKSGRLRTEFHPLVRSLAVGRYIVFFCGTSPVEIVRVLHGARSFPEDIESL